MNKDEILNLCFNIDFPQTEINDASIIRNFNSLKNGSPSPYGNCCINIIQMFHTSLWKANRKGYVSPYDAWYDPILVSKAIDNRLKYKGEELSPIDIRAAFSIAKIAPKVSIFRPALAKYIIQKYLNDYEEIFDPFSGYSGRLLGASALKKKYIGQDINPITVKESRDIIEKLELRNTEINVKNSICSRGKYHCLFTCPPYFDKENWNQSIEELSCDEWIDICLKNYDCEKYIFVVDETIKYKNNIIEEIKNKSHMSSSSEFIVLINKNIG